MNFMKMMQQAATIQKKMNEVQEQLAGKTVEFSSGGGMVTAVARGDLSIAKIKIDPKVVDPNDVEMLEDLVFGAIDGALKAARDMAAKDMESVGRGLGLPPGFKLPF